ncbi:MAG: helix-turn-helix domain-containing protein [Sulfitobacter sp.]
MLPVTVSNKEEGGLCPVRNVLSAVTGKWSSLILLSLEDGSLRFSGVKRMIGDITQRVLTENLRTLERDGYISRRVVAGPPVEVHYELTPLGASLVEQFKPLVAWASDHFDVVMASRARYTS